jgi:hypothetical protein
VEIEDVDAIKANGQEMDLSPIYLHGNDPVGVMDVVVAGTYTHNNKIRKPLLSNPPPSQTNSHQVYASVLNVAPLFLPTQTFVLAVEQKLNNNL